MRRSLLFFAFVSLLLFVSVAPASARASEWEPDVEAWLQAVARAKLDRLGKGLRMELDMQLRRLNAPLYYPEPGNPSLAVQSPNTLILLRPYFGYQFRHNMAAWVGYAYQPDLFDDPAMRATRNIHEHRVFTQFTVNDTFSERFELGTRMRMEHRVRTHGPGSPENDGGLSSWAHRLRLFERLAVRFKRDSHWLAVVHSETFFHLNETRYPSKPGIDQQRTFVGIGYRLREPGDRVELGYLNQLVRRFTDPHQLNHVVLLSVMASLPTK